MYFLEILYTSRNRGTLTVDNRTVLSLINMLEDSHRVVAYKLIGDNIQTVTGLTYSDFPKHRINGFTHEDYGVPEEDFGMRV